MNGVVILGARADGHAKVVLDALLALGYPVVGFLDDDSALAGIRIGDHQVLGSLALLGSLRSRANQSHPAVSDNPTRRRMAEHARAAGFELSTIVHPAAHVSPTAKLGAGTFAAAGAIIGPGATIGEVCLINTAATIDHDCVLEDGVNICPGVHLAGRVRVGRDVFIGIGANVIPDLVIGAGAIVAAGAVVVRNVRAGARVAGVPAREMADSESRGGSQAG